MIKMKTVVFSLGGSLIVPGEINHKFLISFKQMIDAFVAEGNRAVIVCGGGRTCRTYNDAAKKVTAIKDIDLDWMGIASTKLNAELIRSIFSDIAYEEVVKDPRFPVETDKKVIIGAGFKPGNSSDKVAVMLAIQFQAHTVINMTNVKKVYTDDPRINPDAQPLDEVSWDIFLNIIGEDWIPGKNVPFDPVASKLARDNNIRVIILDGNNLDNLQNLMIDKAFDGTIIKP